MKKALSFLFILSALIAFSQETSTEIKTESKKQKGNLYFSFGYTRACYSKSTIHFKDHSDSYHESTNLHNEYDFTIYDVKASDRPDFDKIPDVVNISVPQYVYRIGYYFNDKKDLGVEINFDHTKYIVNDYQRVHIKGQFNGTPVDKDTVLDPKNFLHFEHSDGANFLMVNMIKRWKLYDRKKFNVGWVAKGGAGMVIPRTDVTLFGERLNNRFHIAGWIAGVETGLRTEFLRHGFFEFVAKGSFADYMNVLVVGAGSRAHHYFFTGQLTATIGLMF
jgi:hypothetical protein